MLATTRFVCPSASLSPKSVLMGDYGEAELQGSLFVLQFPINSISVMRREEWQWMR